MTYKTVIPIDEVINIECRYLKLCGYVLMMSDSDKKGIIKSQTTNDKQEQKYYLIYKK